MTLKGYNDLLTNVSGFVEYACVTPDALSLSAKPFQSHGPPQQVFYEKQ